MNLVVLTDPSIENNTKCWINYEKKIIPEKASIYITTQLCFPLGEKYIFSDMNLEVNPFLQRNLEASVDIPYKIMN